MIAIFAVLFFIAGAWAAPMEGSDYIPACGEKYGITKEYHDAFNPLEDDWSHDVKCYAVCEAEHEGFYVDGRPTEEFVNKEITVADDADDDDKLAAALMKDCFVEASYENCEGVHSVLKCAVGSAIGVGVAKAFIDAIFEHMIENL